MICQLDSEVREVNDLREVEVAVDECLFNVSCQRVLVDFNRLGLYAIVAFEAGGQYESRNVGVVCKSKINLGCFIIVKFDCFTKYTNHRIFEDQRVVEKRCGLEIKQEGILHVHWEGHQIDVVVELKVMDRS